MKPQVHSRKHYVQQTLTTVTTGVVNSLSIVIAVNLTAANVANEVPEGSTVKAVFCEIWAIGSVSNQFFTAIIYKNQGGGTTITNTEMPDLFTYDNKKNILWSSQGLASNDGIAGPYPLIKQWLKIPKSKQRFGLGDKLQFSLMSRGSDDIIFCGEFVYKEYT